jgi:hypothetical protein
MQPLQLNLNSNITDSCSSCACCFPKKDKKKKEKSVDTVAQNTLQKKATDQQDKIVKDSSSF